MAILKPKIIGRSEWGASLPGGCSTYFGRTLADLARAYNKITVHHDAQWADPGLDLDEAKLRMRSHQQQHINQGWCDLGYHYVMDPSGNIFAGRSIFSIGAHVEGVNTGNLGVCVMGAYHQQSFPKKAEDPLVHLLAYLCEALDLSPDSIYGHRDFNVTECPGSNFYSRLPIIRQRVHEALDLDKPVVDPYERLKVFYHSEKTSATLGSKPLEKLDLRIKLNNGKLDVTLNGKKVTDMKALTLELVRDSQ